MSPIGTNHNIQYSDLPDLKVGQPHAIGEEAQDPELPYSSISDFIIILLALEGFIEQFSISSDRFCFSPISAKERKTSAHSTWLLYTSGTTGTPKKIAHNTESLCASIRLSETTSHCWGLTYKPNKFAGLQVLLQSLLNGDCLVDCTLGTLDEKVALMVESKVSAISATPSWWRQLLMTQSLEALSLSRITLGGEIADQQLLNALSSRFTLAKIFHIYASTEAGVGFAVSDKKAGFPLSWIKDGVNKTQLKIKNNLLWVKPFSDNVQLNTNMNAIETDDLGYINTQDAVAIEGERVYFKGRINGAINVGGHKVFPETVESVLLTSPLVSQARVYGKENKILGNIVVADLVLNASSEPLKHKDVQLTLMLHCKKYLDRNNMPTKINVVDELTLSDNGKLKRH
ncbi:MAG: AMP-binding protein [Alteromonas macleodii]|nr:AMP-binding protein [Alteromonas macleodii]